MLTGLVVQKGGNGFWFIEQDFTRDSHFVHQRSVVKRKFLHVGDRVRFNIAPNPYKSGETHAVDVEIIGITIARQVSERKAQP
jgi:cold shock CspA family protein